MRFLFLPLSFVFLFCSAVSAQDNDETQSVIDSLQKVIRSDVHDTVRLKALQAWDDMIYYSDPVMDLQLNLKIDSIARKNLKKNLTAREKRFFSQKLAASLNVQGIYKQEDGELLEAMRLYNSFLELSKELGNQKDIASAYSNIGNLHSLMGNYSQAANDYTTSLRIREKIGDTVGIATSHNNLGMLYKDNGQISMGIYHISMAHDLIRNRGLDWQVSLAANNLGTMKQDLGDSARDAGNPQLGQQYFQEALVYYNEALELSQRANDGEGIGIAYHNLGSLHQDLLKDDEALQYYLLALENRTSRNDKVGTSSTLTNISKHYFRMNNVSKAIEYGRRALAAAKETGAFWNIYLASDHLKRCYVSAGDYRSALEMSDLAIEYKDSIYSEKNKKGIIQQEFKYKYEKKSAADSVAFAKEKELSDLEIEKHKAELSAKRNQQIALFGGLILVLTFAGFIFNRFRVTQRQKVIIEEQKNVVEKAHHELEEKNKEILDSINYARRIQTAILPPSRIVKEYLQESFILYKPKDIVAGDFYWMHPTEGGVFFAACDCTGHGVPGAMVSVVCNNGLNRSVREYGLTDPGKILDKTREIVIAEFEKSEEEVKDGMDISLVSLEQNNRNEPAHSVLRWAGANNPIWILPKDASDISELIELKPDKQPIGKYAEPRPFTTHQMDLKRGDTLYIFTDGFADQFGGEQGKKFKAANFKKLLLSVQSKSMEEQREQINEAFETWRGSLEQVDDVCVIGVRI